MLFDRKQPMAKRFGIRASSMPVTVSLRGIFLTDNFVSVYQSFANIAQALALRN
jgi:hypothetical protein